MTDETPLPVWLLTGFLGSGKTTLLARLIRAPELSDTAVIVNEFGEVGLDHHLIARGEEDDVVLLDSGCLCCAMGDSLAETLTELFHRRRRGEIAPFSRVIIETTGMADPGPILRSLLSDRVMMQRFAIAGVITTIDGVFGVKQLHDRFEAQRQAALADRIVITKRDVIGAQDEEALRARLSQINPGAEIMVSAHAEIDPSRLLNPAERSPLSPAPQGAHDHGGAISTIFLPVPAPISWEQYAQLVRRLQVEFAETLLRAKGVLRIEGEAAPMVVQGVELVFAPPAELARGEPAQFGLVLIGERLDRERLASRLADCGVRLD